MILGKKRKILWFTWKDKKNPYSGGAEVVNQEIAKRLAKDGHKVIFIVAGFPKSLSEEIINGYKIIRVGNRWSVYLQAYKYYKRHLQSWADIIIEEINTIPFFSQLYAKEKKILIFYQLCREIWFYQISFPLSLIGYLFEPFYLWLLRKNKVITISKSTKDDLLKYGFKKRNINIMTPGIEISPVNSLGCHSALDAESINKIDSRWSLPRATTRGGNDTRGRNDKERVGGIKKYNNFTLLSLGAIRKMKRPDQQIKAFELAKRKIPELKLKIAGSGRGRYYQKIIKLIESSPYKKDIEYLGKVSCDDKIELMQKCHLILATSVKEGWGLIVTEANSQGAPAIVYNVDGLRDSVKDNETGLVATKNTSQYLARSIVELAKNKKKYARLQRAGWEWSKEINFDNCYQQFLEVINEKYS